MATTGSISESFNGSTGHCASLIIDWSYTQNIEQNTTTLKATLKVKRLKSGTVTSKSVTPYNLVVDGTTKSGNYDFDITEISVGSSITIATLSKTFTHNADGTHSAIAVSGKFDVSGTTLGASTPSGSVALATIPRATTPTVSASSVDMGGSVTFTLNRASTSFTHTLTYSFAGATGTIGTELTTSKAWTVPDLASKIPSKTSDVCTITCITYNGTTEIGRKTLTMTLNVPASVKPTVTLTVAEAVADVASKVGVYLKGLSKLNITATGSGASGSTISAYSISANGTTYNTSTVTTGYLATAGSMTITATVTDTRGRTGTASKTITVVDYKKPYVTSFDFYRSDSTGAELSDGNYLRVGYSVGITEITGNTPTYTLSYKKKSDTTYTSQTLTSKSGTAILSGINTDYSYDIKLEVKDAFNTTSVLGEVGTAFTLMDYHSSGRGMAIGKVAETEGILEIDIPVVFNKAVSGIDTGATIDINDEKTKIVNMIYPVGAIYMSVNATSPATLFGGTWVQIKDRFLLSAGDTYSAGTTGGSATHTLTVAEMPTHTHTQNAHSHSTRYKGFDLSSDKEGYMVLRRNETADGYDGTDTDGAISATATNQNTGGGGSHNNMPPYLTVYVWKRTA